jgi:hypothetical protein
MTFEKYPTARVRAGSILRRAADGRRFVVRSVRRKPADDVELTHQRSAPMPMTISDASCISPPC